MRTKALLCLAAVAAIAIPASAQVYSANVVGYVNVTIPANQYKIIANPLVQADSSIGSILQVPGGTSLLKWNGVTFIANTYDPDFGWDDPNMPLVPGEGAFIKNNTANPITLTFVGEVSQATNSVSFQAGSYKMASLFTPQAGLITTDFGFPGGAGDVVQQWNGITYSSLVFDPDFGWDPVEPTITVGEGFFVKTATAKTWTRSFKVAP